MRSNSIIGSALILLLMMPLQASAVGPNDIYPDIKKDAPLSEAELTAAFKGKKHLGTYNFLTKDIANSPCSRR